MLEILAFALSVAMVIGNLRIKVWAWPLAVASSACYGLLFAANALYGEASLQLFFIAVAVWGWRQWRRDERQGSAPSAVGRMSVRQRAWTLAAGLLAWPVLGLVLKQATDSDVPFADALPTVGSVIGQLLLIAKRVENWWVWLAVNVASVGLFAFKALWLTALLYAVFAVLSVAGLRAWQRLGASHG